MSLSVDLHQIPSSGAMVELQVLQNFRWSFSAPILPKMLFYGAGS
jgi:hypothetical protein